MRKLYAQLAMLLVMSLFFSSIQAYGSELNINGFLQDGYISAPGEENIPVYYNDSYIDGLSTGDDSSLPAYYMTDKLPALKSQGSYETCWAFSSVALGEIYVLNHSDEFGELEKPDFAEAQLAYFMYNTVPDPLGGTAGDNNSFLGAYNAFSKGGSILYAENVLNSWIGLVSENEVPYSSIPQIKNDGLSEELAYSKDQIHMTGYKNLNIKANRNDAKELIMKNGAVASRIYISRQYYNNLYNSYYYSGSKTVNHAITIVGWDDDFSCDKFASKPAGDGAWIVKNSYINSEIPQYSYNGYFYLSYYDASLSTAYAFEFESSDKHDANYQYDGGMVTNAIKGTNPAAANVFTARDTEYGEYIDTVGFYSGETNSSFDIDIYIDIPDGEAPVAGRHVVSAKTTGKTDLQGFYSVPLSNAVYVAPNSKFAAVVAFKSNGAHGIEGESKPDWVNYYSKVAVQPQQSYVRVNGIWTDVTEIDSFSGTGNVRIKAYSRNAAASADNFNKTEAGQNNNSTDAGDNITIETGDGSSTNNSSDSPEINNSSAENNSSSAEQDIGDNASVNKTESEPVVTVVRNNSTAAHNGYLIEYECGADIREISNLPVITEYIPQKGMKAIKLPKPVRNGYTFKGWYLNGRRISKITSKLTGNLVISARWVENTYSIKYKKGTTGDTKLVKGSMCTVRKVPYSRLVVLDNCGYTREGYTFAGWSIDKNSRKVTFENCEKVKSLMSKNRSSIKLYAVWNKQ